MKIIPVLTFFSITFFLIAGAFAVPPGKTAIWSSDTDDVVFNGMVHAQKGLTCADCHSGLFETSRSGIKMSMKAMDNGSFCGSCHNGVKGFSTADTAACSRCHVPKVK